MSDELAFNRVFEFSPRVQLCSAGTIDIGGQRLEPDGTKAYVEFHLSHAFPVVTSDSTAIHPSVVERSYRSMLHQVFNVGHVMKSYNPDQNSRDRIIGSVVAVELTGMRGRVQSDRSKSLGIRAVAVIHKLAEWSDKIMAEHLGGRRQWTVSMENMFRVSNSGYLVRDADMAGEFPTPADLLELGWVYVPHANAPDKLAQCFDGKRARMTKWGKRDAVFLVGGIDGDVHYNGVGITPLGKEPTAEITTLLASGYSFMSGDSDAEEPIEIALKKLVPAVE